ncbi:hypothetical protein RCG19_05560 [Neobacillus sp. OS1-2]|uniref:hypothetical protein n=1 Tax=Neobacillus sp. OS1-2 TaxID=3070680 RepID=UPI0027DF244C|nr:hypothetical protein [Neobacillus sp. OS1-2]WML41123.1 hypothetical protein RCG19_05560 [Neobacillus sp. OS1-2]
MKIFLKCLLGVIVLLAIPFSKGLVSAEEINNSQITNTSDQISGPESPGTDIIGIGAPYIEALEYDLSESPNNIILDENNVLFFETQGDFESYQNALNHDNTIFFRTPSEYEAYQNTIDPIQNNADYGYQTIPTLVSSTRETNHWVGYHSGTPAWTPASSYTLTKGKTYSTSGSYKYKDITVQLGFSYITNISTTIPADSKRLSRLGIWGDYTFSKYKYTEYFRGVPTGKAPTYAVIATRHSYVIKPAYR